MRHDDFTTDTKPGGMDHTYHSLCPAYAKWCRIHRYPDWTMGTLTHYYFPAEFPVATGSYTKSDGTPGIVWTQVMVYCGPGGFYPPRGKRGK